MLSSIYLAIQTRVQVSLFNDDDSRHQCQEPCPFGFTVAYSDQFLILVLGLGGYIDPVSLSFTSLPSSEFFETLILNLLNTNYLPPSTFFISTILQ